MAGLNIIGIGDNMLTLEKLKEMEPGMFARGVFKYDQVQSGIYGKWIASRGGIYDWAIYAGYEEWSYERVKDHGDKITTESVIKRLVPCTDEAFEMYRY